MSDRSKLFLVVFCLVFASLISLGLVQKTYTKEIPTYNSLDELCKSVQFLPVFIADDEAVAACRDVRMRNPDFIAKRNEFWREFDRLTVK